ncbi:MAG: Gfo/Idh/MocA family oxidoreductase [Gemmatimonadota bacterium]|nr:Gfo/Idh/MocA family oxidoreductase [Gemmatimonadota bacterium]
MEPRSPLPSRREFLGDVGLAGAAFTIVPGHVLGGRGRTAPSDTLNVACIGVGGMGASDVRGMRGENIYALCDVDTKSARESVQAFPGAKFYRDFREMLDREAGSIDAVTVSTPDHTHAVAAIAALRAGKPVYCQKPLARTIGEVRAMADAARQAGVPTVMGNQGHAGEGIRLIREWVDAGLIGTVREVHFWTNRPIWPQAIERPTEMHHVPAHLDWDLWLGPAADRPYHPAYAPFRWRGWWDFGTGAFGDMACHIMDAAYWTLGLRYPARVDVESTAVFDETGPRASRVDFAFPAREGRPAVTLVWRDGGLLPPAPPEVAERSAWPPAEDGGQLWIGSEGKLIAGTYGQEPRLLDPARRAQVEAEPLPQRFPRLESVYAEFAAAVKGGPEPGSNFPGYAAPFTEMILLGNLAVRMGRSLEVEPETGRITNVEVPRAWVQPDYRAGWRI